MPSRIMFFRFCPLRRLRAFAVGRPMKRVMDMCQWVNFRRLFSTDQLQHQIQVKLVCRRVCRVIDMTVLVWMHLFVAVSAHWTRNRDYTFIWKVVMLYDEYRMGIFLAKSGDSDLANRLSKNWQMYAHIFVALRLSVQPHMDEASDRFV